MSPKTWGPPVWLFFHTFSVNISDYGYSKVGMQFFSYITRICRMLPCPECSEHATKHISGVHIASLKTKTDMANMLYAFHNMVNARKRLPLFIHSNLSWYENVSIVHAFNSFAYAFTIPTQRLMNENLHRKLLVNQMNQFITDAIRSGYFHKPIPITPPPVVPTTKEEINNTEKTELPRVPSVIYEEEFVSDTDNSSVVSSSSEESSLTDETGENIQMVITENSMV